MPADFAPPRLGIMTKRSFFGVGQNGRHLFQYRMARYHELLEHLGTVTGLPELAPDEEGAVRLLFRNNLDLMLQSGSEEEEVLACATVATYDSADPAMLLDLLEANLFWQRTGGGTFAVEHSLGHVILQKAWRLESLDAETFEKELADFVGIASYWVGELNGGDLEPTSEESSPIPCEDADTKSFSDRV